MTLFTHSPFVNLMQQFPTLGGEVHGPPALPPTHPCHGCPYRRDAPCLGVCYRDLLRKK